MSKKTIIPVLLLCLLLSACGQNANPTQPTTSAPPSSSSTTLPTGLSGGEIPLLCLVGMDSYKKFVELADLPENFVYYESLTDFGELDSLVILSMALDEYQAEDYSKYLYNLIDENGNELDLFVGVEPSDKPLSNLNYWGDMRAAGHVITERVKRISQNGVEYLYIDYSLSYIEWVSNGIRFSLHADAKDEAFYPEDGPLTIVQELLHTDTNKTAVERFEAALNTPAVK